MELTDRFTEALVFATELHATQRRKVSGEPYLSHLLAVTATVLRHGREEDEAIAALLHDAVEDQGGRPTLEKIRRRFGDRVAAIVEGCTDADTVPKPPWRQRKEAYVAHLGEADASVRLVSAADKLHNARSILLDFHTLGDRVWDRFRGGRDGTLWYLRNVVDALTAVESTPLVEELDRVVGELERAAGMGFASQPQT